MKKSTAYELMRKSELMDDDGMDIEEAERSSSEKYKEQYKEFYTDIKLDIREDW